MVEKAITLKKALESGQLDRFIKQEDSRLKVQEGYPPSFASFKTLLTKFIKPRQSKDRTSR
jgi:hypothetical protein